MDHLSPLVHKFKQTPVLCIGDLMLDVFVYGDVTRISPEAPIPILHVKKEFSTLGGVGNVVHNILALEGRPFLVAAVGDDESGESLLKLLRSKQVDPREIARSSKIQTIVKHRYCGREQQLLRVDYENIRDFPDTVYDAMIASCKEIIPQVKSIVLSDYGKGTLHPLKVIRPILELAHEWGIPVIADPKGFDYGIYQGCTVITPNRSELRQATKLETQTDDQVIAASRSLIKKTGVENVLATRSDEGMTLVPRRGKPLHIRTVPREVFDVSGAGDTVVATLALGLGAGVSLVDAAKISNVAATLVVGKVGTATTSASELVHALEFEEIYTERKKVVSLQEAMEMVLKWRRRGYSIGFTNGCFDLLHMGHLSLLKKSKAECQKLIVAINSDESVQKLKGPSRPVQSEVTRSSILSALEVVDLVILFSEDTPLKLIQALHPDVLIKGADYTVDRVVGADLVVQSGGKVILVPLEEGNSTTATVRKIQQ